MSRNAAADHKLGLIAALAALANHGSLCWLRSLLVQPLARCPGVSFIEDGVIYWREGCDDCLRRTSPGSERSNSMSPPPILAFWCEGYIEP
jgi:hypothetical protein